MTNKEKKIIGTILHIVKDKKEYIPYQDCLLSKYCISWFENKINKIEELSEMLPHIDFEDISEDDEEMEDIVKNI